MVTLNLAKSNTSAQISDEEFVCAGVSELCRGRAPFAYADISDINEKDGEIKGRASFYYTPLGLLACVTANGLDESVSVYPLSFVSKEGARWSLPPLYNKNGFAWCTALTGKISVCEILGGELRIGESKSKKAVALGEIICPLSYEIS
ncbi:MAG: hypothetical protein IJZ83_06265 [Clostridia bacterium]|nr:hypothetical protein [Clostridia bacterium]MBR4014006.1 hypothetical protein [Clostridia bacterium]